MITGLDMLLFFVGLGAFFILFAYGLKICEINEDNNE